MINDLKNSANQTRSEANYWANATIDDLAKKYGFDFSREWANRQAAVEAQSKRNALKDTGRRNQTNYQEIMKQIENSLRETSYGLDRNYFTQMLGQNQNLSDRGLTGGVAADQNLRLAMAKQGDMSNMFRDANQNRFSAQNQYNLEAQRILEALGLVDAEEKVTANRYFQDGRQQGFGNLMQQRTYSQGRSTDAFGMYNNEQSRLDAMSRFNQEMALQREKFNYQKQQDQLAAQRAAAARSASGGRSSGGSGGSGGGGAGGKGPSINDLYSQFQKENPDTTFLAGLQRNNNFAPRQRVKSYAELLAERNQPKSGSGGGLYHIQQ